MEGNTSSALIGAVEAVLFACGEPVSLARLQEACHVGKPEICQALETLEQQYRRRKSALHVQQLENAYQLCTRQEYAGVIARAAETKKSVPLSPAAMEVLTIVAYNQPVSKSFVEHVRGVDSSSVVNTLVAKELLTEAGRLAVPGHPIAYATTPHFLRCFGLSSLEELPPLPNVIQQESPEELLEEDALPASQ